MVPLGRLLLWSLIEQDTAVPRVGRDGGRGGHHDRPRGAGAADRHHLRRRDAAHDPAGGAQPAAQRGGVAGLGEHDLPRQDRHADRGPPARGRAGRRRRRRRGRAVGPARPLRGQLAEPQLDARGDRGERTRARAEPVREGVPFSSRRRWSGLSMGGRAYVLGAPEHFALGAHLQERARRGGRGRAARAGLRRRRRRRCRPPARTSPPPSGLRPMGLVVLAEELRPDARETVAFLLEQGIDIKVISGDAPATVAAIAADAGIPVRGEPVDGRELPPDATPAARAGARGDGGGADLARRQEALRGGAGGRGRATSRWSATASTTSRR